MKTRYPIRNNKNKDFATVEDVMTLLNGESFGTWLLGTNGMWHGGIHFSDLSAPHSVLTEENISNEETVPLQCMADGKIVAYRLNSEYLTDEYCEKTMRYSSSFVLVRSVCQPKEDDSETWLTFYTLYMHLAPVSDYPNVSVYKVKAGKTLSKRKYTAGNRGLPEGTPAEHDRAQYAAPAKVGKVIKKRADGKEYDDGCVEAGDRLLVSQTGQFYLLNQLHTFGLARKIVLGQPRGEQFWITLDEKYVDTDGEMRNLMPEWLFNAAYCGITDSVVVLSEAEPLEIKAGAPIGHIGCMDSPTDKVNLVDTDHYVHIEVLSTDPNMPQFLTNPKAVTEGKKYIKVLQDKPLFIKASETTTPPTFVATENTLGTDYIFTRAETTPVKDAADETWFKVSESGWVKESDAEALCQYDLQKLGFIALEENSAGNMAGSDREAWIAQAFSHIADAASRAPGMDYALVPQGYHETIAAMDSNQDGRIDDDEVRQALTVRDPLVQKVVNRLVVKHHSEWFEDENKWKTFYEQLPRLQTPYVRNWLKRMAWMSKVAPFNQEEAVWHFHPVEFLTAVADLRCDCEELYKDKFKVTRYGTHYGPVYKGTIKLADYQGWTQLISSGAITEDEKTILVAMSENEGNMDAIHSYDSEVVTAGAMQKTVKQEKKAQGTGELSTQLAKFRDLYPDLYETHAVNCGWSVVGNGKNAITYYCDSILTNGRDITHTELGTLLRQGCNVDNYGKTISSKPLAALLKIITLPKYLDLQVTDFIDRLHNAEDQTLSGYNKSIKSYVKSNFGRGLILDHSVNRPGNVPINFKSALDNFYAKNPLVNKDPDVWDSNHLGYENSILEEYKLTRNMTDSVSRYENLEKKLK